MRDSSADYAVEHGEPALFPQTRAEYLYRFLDNRVVHGRQGNWRVCVYSVVEAGEQLWVQTAVIGPAVHSVLLRARQSTEPGDALFTLESWLSVAQDRED